MRSLIRLLVIFSFFLVVIGLYRGWFHLSSSHPEPQDSKVNVDVSVDKAKMKSDIRRAEGKIEEEVEEIEGKLDAKKPAK